MKLMHQVALSQCNFIINQSDDPFSICGSIIDVLERLLAYRRGCIILQKCSESCPAIYFHRLRGIKEDTAERELMQVNSILGNKNGGVINSVIKSGSSIIVPDVKQDDMYLEASADIQSEACVPVTVAGRTFGAFNFESRNRSFFGAEDALLLQSLANQVALMLDRADHQRTFEQTNFDRIRAAALPRNGIPKRDN